MTFLTKENEVPYSSMSPTIAIIVEWENAILAGDEVAQAMLDRLAEESRSLDNVRELRFVFDPSTVDAAALQSLVTDRLSAQKYDNSATDLVFQPVEGLHYYEFKNAGARATHMDIVAYLDSDSLPDPGWINELTAPLLADENCVAAAGATHIRPGSTIDAAFAAGWFFPMLADVKPKDYTHHFFANNVAFRRSYLVQNPFPELPQGVTRGACSNLARTMAADNQKISYRPSARAWHPPPNGLNHFVTRALAQGRDDAYNAPSQNIAARLGQVCMAFGRIIVVPVLTTVRIAQNRKHLKVGLLGPVAGAMVMLAYSTLQCAGFLIALTIPGIARHSWKI